MNNHLWLIAKIQQANRSITYSLRSSRTQGSHMLMILFTHYYWHCCSYCCYSDFDIWFTLCGDTVVPVEPVYHETLLSQVIDHTQRLGCAEAGGYAALKAHEFFAGMEWDTLHLQSPPELHPFLPANSEDSENLWSQYTVMFCLLV